MATATIQGVYLALFGRPADPVGLAFFNGVTNNGADLTAIGDLANTAEYQSRFVNMSNEQIVNSIYQSLFGRDGEPAGVQFWVSGLANGDFNINNIAIAILQSAQNTDLATVNAKLAAADLFTAHLDLDTEKQAYSGTFAASVGRDYINAVSATDAATPEEADTAILRLFNPDEGQGPGGEQPGGGGGGGGNGGDIDPPPVVNPLTLPSALEDSGAYTITAAQLLSTSTDVGPTKVLSVSSFTLTSGNGTLVDNGNGTWTYTPAANDQTEAKFGLTVSDGVSQTSGVALLDLVAVNDAPSFALGATVTVAEDAGAQTLAGYLSGLSAGPADEASQTLVVSVVTDKPELFANAPTLDLATGNLAFTPAPDANGNATVTVTVTDNGGTDNGGKNSYTQTFNIAVTAVDDAPVAVADSVTVAEDGSVSVNVLSNDTDIDGGPKAVASITQAANGTVSINNDGTLFYKPNADFNGTDSFTYKLNGGSTATVSVTVTPVDDVPVAVADTATVAEDGSVSIDVVSNDTDIDGGPKSVQSVSQGTNGTVSIGNDGKLVYTPKGDFNGQDSFTYTLNGGSTSTVSVVVTPVNDAPKALASTNAVTENVTAPVTGNLLTGATDVDGDTLFVLDPSTYKAAYGTLVVNADGTYSYTLDNANATVDALTAASPVLKDVINFTIADGKGGQANSALTISITGANDKAVVTGITNLPVQEDGVQTAGATLTISDPDLNEAKFVAPTAAELDTKYGAFTLNTTTNAWTYTLDNTAAQELVSTSQVTESLVVKTVDGTATTISVKITGRDDTAVISGTATGSVTEDASTLTVSNVLTVVDLDKDQAGFKPVTGAALIGQYGNFTFNAASGAWAYTLDASKSQALNVNSNVQEKLTVTSLDGSATQTITVNLAGKNDAPTITLTSGQATWSLDENNTATTLATFDARDVDNGAPTLKLAGDTSFFELQGNKLVLKANVDYEQLPANDKVLNVSVVATDAANQSNKLDFAVTIKDVVEVPPITFDEFNLPDGGNQLIANGYKGLNWSNFAVYDPQNGYGGYPGGVVSGENIGFNSFGSPASISSPNKFFDFESFYAAGAWNDDLVLKVTGYAANGSVIGSQTFILDYGVAKQYELDDTIFNKVSSVSFETSGGIDGNPSDQYSGNHAAFDNLVIII